MKFRASLLLLGLAACEAVAADHFAYPGAQRIVRQVAERHADVVSLTVHTVPRDSVTSRVVASNIPAKIDHPSDAEDLQAVSTKEPVVLAEGSRLDYTAPVLDDSGRAIAAVGVTVRGTDAEAMRASAEAIARELSTALLDVGKERW